MKDSNDVPFLWTNIKNVKLDLRSSGGQERPGTESIVEENGISLIKIDYNS